MSDVTNPHDKFFKDTFSQPSIVRDFIENYVPNEIVAALDLSVLELQKDSFVDEELQEHLSDMLYRTRLRDGSTLSIYFLFEHKSYPDRWSLLQLLRYEVQIWEQELKSARDDKRPLKSFKLTPILPLLVYHGEREWGIRTEFNTLFDLPDVLQPYFPDFRHLLVDLSTASDEAIRGLAQTRFVLELMRFIRSDQLLEELVRLLRQLEIEPEDKLLHHLILVAFRYMMSHRNDISVGNLRQAIALAALPNGDKTIMTLAEQLRNEGFQLGQQEGFQLGQQKGFQIGALNATRGNIISILKGRFYFVPKKIEQKLNTIEDLEQLNHLAVTAALVISVDAFNEHLFGKSDAQA